jgi:chaperonin GroES
MSIGIQPIGANIVVLPEAKKDTTASGLYVPETAKGTPVTGTVVAVGTGRVNHETGDTIPLEVQEGNSVLYREGAGEVIERDGTKYLFMSERDVLGIILPT